jgi:hypothetical protein
MPDKPFHELSALAKADQFLVWWASLVTPQRRGLTELEATHIKHFAAWCDDHDHRSRSEHAEQAFPHQEER